MANATITDVAQLAGVSMKTVSRVVNQEPNVSEPTRLRVEQAIKALNYRPNQAARSLASHHSRLIGLVYDDPSVYQIPSAGYIIKMQEGALRACRASGYELLIHPCQIRGRDVRNDLQMLIEKARPSGIILAAPLSNMTKIVQSIEATGTPLVQLSPGTRTTRRSSVSTNDREISAEMTCFLASLGHRRIAFIKGNPDHKAVSNRFLGYKDGLARSQLKYSDNLVAAGDNSIGSGESCATHLLRLKNRPTAIFCANDDMAAGVIRVADRLGISVPTELSVSGCDDIALAQQVYPTLTTINQPFAAMAERAVMKLVDRIRTRAAIEYTEVVPAELMVRDSTGPAPT